MHLPIARTVPSLLIDHCWAVVPLQSYIWRWGLVDRVGGGMSMHLLFRAERRLEPVPPPPSFCQAETRTQSISMVCGNWVVPSG